MVRIFAVQASGASEADARTPAAREQSAHAVLGGEEGTGQVDGDSALPGIEREIRDLRALTEQLDAGVRHDHVDRDAYARHPRVGGTDALLVRDVHAQDRKSVV